MTLTVDIDDTDDGRVLLEQRLLLTMQAVGPALTPIEPAAVRTVLTWTNEDPLVVEVAFLNEEVAGTRWIWGRDLLHAGLTEAAGIAGFGDLHVRPGGPGETQIELSTDGRALFTAPTARLRAFLQRTYDVLPAGTEYELGTAARRILEDDLGLFDESGPLG